MITEEANLQAIDGLPFDRLGAAVSMGRYFNFNWVQLETAAFVGAPSADGVQSRTGAVYVFSTQLGSAWQWMQRFRADDGEPGDLFGAAVSSSESATAVVVGAPGHAHSSGRAYVFQRLPSPKDGWVFEATLAPSDLQQSFAFGSAVAIGDWTPGKEPRFLAVGAPHADGALPGHGAVYLFHRPVDGVWTAFQKLVGPPDAVNFGASLALAFSISLPDALVIGAPGDELTPGSAFVFTLDDGGTPSILDDSWTERARLFATGGGGGDEFGSSVALRHSTNHLARSLAIGAPGRNTAYVFALDEGGTPSDAQDDLWILQAQLVPTSTALDARFGASVAIDGPRLLVGAPRSDPHGSAGEVYGFERDLGGTPDPLDDTWDLTRILQASVPSDGDGFGAAVGIHMSSSAIGAPSGGQVPEDSGTAYAAESTDVSQPSHPLLLEPFHDPVPTSVAIDGDTLALGTRDESDIAPYQGAVRVYRREGDRWEIEAKLTAPETATSLKDYGFGESVALDGDRIIVGALNSQTDKGAAYVFRRSQGIWWLEGKLLVPTGQKVKHLATDVDIDGDVAVVGQPDYESPPGRALVYRYRDGAWKLDGILSPSHPVQYGWFGRSIALHGKRIAVGVGAPGGPVDVFTRTPQGWVLEQAIAKPEDPLFGYYVDLHGDHLAVSGSQLVGVYSRESGAWIEEAQFPGKDRFTLDRDQLLVGRLENSLVPGHWGALSLHRRTASGWNEAFLLAARGTSGPVGGQTQTKKQILGGSPVSLSGLHVVAIAETPSWAVSEADVFSFELPAASTPIAAER